MDLFDQDRADEPDGGGLVEKGAGYSGGPLDPRVYLIRAFKRSNGLVV